MADAVHAFGTAPVLSSALLAETIGVSIRTALTILDEMTDLGLLKEITGRRTARIWAVPSLGARLAARPAREAKLRAGTPSLESHDTGRLEGREKREAAKQTMEHAFADLDVALDGARALLIDTQRRS